MVGRFNHTDSREHAALTVRQDEASAGAGALSGRNARCGVVRLTGAPPRGCGNGRTAASEVLRRALEEWMAHFAFVVLGALPASYKYGSNPRGSVPGLSGAACVIPVKESADGRSERRDLRLDPLRVCQISQGRRSRFARPLDIAGRGHSPDKGRDGGAGGERI